MADWKATFLDWIQEWIDTSASSNASAAYVYKKAFKSLSDSNQQYQHPMQLISLRFFGEKICRRLEKRLEQYCKENSLEVPSMPRDDVEFVSPGAPGNKARKQTTAKTTTTRKKKQFVPRHRSGGYAILLALRKIERKFGDKSGAAKAEIVALGREFCDASFEPDPNMKNFYSAWNSIKTLITNNCVYQQGKKYLLTQEGRDVADKLRTVEKENDSEVIHQLWSTPQNSDRSSPNAGRIMSMPPNEPRESTVTWEKGSFKIKVLVDTREIKSRGCEDNRTFFKDELTAAGLDASITALALGDVLWVAEHQETGSQAIVDHILERKRLDDLIGSLKDNRFVEQKFRLHRSSCKQVIYLIEHPPTAPVPIQFQTAYQSALSQTAIMDNFALKRTGGAEETAKYLIAVTKHLQQFFQDRTLTVVAPSVTKYKQSMETAREQHTGYIGIDFDVFSRAMSKSGMLTVRDVFIKMLMCVRGISWDKAIAIQKVYKTPHDLWLAYHGMDDEEKKKKLVSSALAHNVTRKRVNKPASERLYEVWGSQKT